MGGAKKQGRGNLRKYARNLSASLVEQSTARQITPSLYLPSPEHPYFEICYSVCLVFKATSLSQSNTQHRICSLVCVRLDAGLYWFKMEEQRSHTIWQKNERKFHSSVWKFTETLYHILKTISGKTRRVSLTDDNVSRCFQVIKLLEKALSFNTLSAHIKIIHRSSTIAS